MGPIWVVINETKHQICRPALQKAQDRGIQYWRIHGIKTSILSYHEGIQKMDPYILVANYLRWGLVAFRYVVKD